jgi:hypothetical protein
MGWLDNLWRRRRPERPPEAPAERAGTREDEGKDKRLTADELEERAHQHRDEAIFREPRVPPGTG